MYKSTLDMYMYVISDFSNFVYFREWDCEHILIDLQYQWSIVTDDANFILFGIVHLASP